MICGSGAAGRKTAASASSTTCSLIDDANRDRLVRTGLHARRRLAHRQPRRAHVALADDALAGVILRHVVRAGQRAVLAAEALIVEMLDDAGDGSFSYALTGQAIMQAGSRQWWHAAVTCCITGAEREPPIKQADVAPRFVFVEAVERVAGDDARLAAASSGRDRLRRHTAGPARAASRASSERYWRWSMRELGVRVVAVRVPAAELLDGGERLLLVEQLGQREPPVAGVELTRAARSAHCSRIGSEISPMAHTPTPSQVADSSAWALQSDASLQPISVAITGSSTSGGGSSTYTCSSSTFTRKRPDAILLALQRLARFERERLLVQRAGDLRLLAGAADDAARQHERLLVRAHVLAWRTTRRGWRS